MTRGGGEETGFIEKKILFWQTSKITQVARLEQGKKIFNCGAGEGREPEKFKL